MSDFYQFAPMAKTSKGEPLFTYDTLDTFEKAVEQFNIWTDHYHYDIVEAWIDITNNGEKVKTIHLQRAWVPINEEEVQDPHPEFMGRQLRDIVTEKLPQAVDANHRGGIVGCPGDYSFFSRAYNCNPLRTGDVGSCSKCWSQIYTGIQK